MADKMTTTTTSTPAKKAPKEPTTEEKATRVEAALEELREALIDSGQDPGTVDAQLHAVQPTADGVVGNFADLQRIGALISKGVAGGAAVEEAVVLDAAPVEEG